MIFPMMQIKQKKTPYYTPLSSAQTLSPSLVTCYPGLIASLCPIHHILMTLLFLSFFSPSSSSFVISIHPSSSILTSPAH